MPDLVSTEESSHLGLCDIESQVSDEGRVRWTGWQREIFPWWSIGWRGAVISTDGACDMGTDSVAHENLYPGHR